jgi:flagellar hook-associated protein 3 FlgL
MIAANSLANINNNYTNMEKYQNQVSSGKKVTKPSDDPIATTTGMLYTSDLNAVDQYKKNVTSLQTWIQNSEGGMQQANSDLSRLRELVVQGMNGSLNADDLKTVATEVQRINGDLANTANTQVAGKYLFHGTDVTHPPVTQNPDGSYSVDENSNNYNFEVSNGVYIRANINQANSFNQEMFSTVSDVQNALENNNTSGLGDLLKRLDNVMNTFSAENSDLGARSNQVDLASNRLDQQETTATSGISNSMDVDIESAVVNMTTQQYAYKAALGVSAQIMQPSLLDFLK